MIQWTEQLELTLLSLFRRKMVSYRLHIGPTYKNFPTNHLTAGASPARQDLVVSSQGSPHSFPFILIWIPADGDSSLKQHRLQPLHFQSQQGPALQLWISSARPRQSPLPGVPPKHILVRFWRETTKVSTANMSQLKKRNSLCFLHRKRSYKVQNCSNHPNKHRVSSCILLFPFQVVSHRYVIVFLTWFHHCMLRYIW